MSIFSTLFGDVVLQLSPGNKAREEGEAHGRNTADHRASIKPGQQSPGRASGPSRPRLTSATLQLSPGNKAREEAMGEAAQPRHLAASIKPGQQSPGRDLAGGGRIIRAAASIKPGQQSPGRGS